MSHAIKRQDLLSSFVEICVCCSTVNLSCNANNAWSYTQGIHISPLNRNKMTCFGVAAVFICCLEIETWLSAHCVWLINWFTSVLRRPLGERLFSTRENSNIFFLFIQMTASSRTKCFDYPTCIKRTLNIIEEKNDSRRAKSVWMLQLPR